MSVEVLNERKEDGESSDSIKVELPFSVKSLLPSFAGV